MLIPGPKPQRRRTTVVELEREYAAVKKDPKRVRRFPELAKPFGFMNREWEAIKARMQPGDELWECCTPIESWNEGMGSSWVELVRDGKPIASLVTKMN